MAETQVSVSRHIAAPAASVWQMISDVTRMGEWSPETTSAAWSHGATGPALGARFSGDNRNGDKTWSLGCTVDECDVGRSFGFAVAAGPLKVSHWSYRIEADPGDGTGCTVTETWTDRRGWLIGKLGKPLSGVADRASHNRVGMEQTLDRLAAAAEG